MKASSQACFLNTQGREVPIGLRVQSAGDQVHDTGRAFLERTIALQLNRKALFGTVQ